MHHTLLLKICSRKYASMERGTEATTLAILVPLGSEERAEQPRQLCSMPTRINHFNLNGLQGWGHDLAVRFKRTQSIALNLAWSSRCVLCCPNFPSVTRLPSACQYRQEEAGSGLAGLPELQKRAHSRTSQRNLLTPKGMCCDISECEATRNTIATAGLFSLFVAVAP
jgi:hypothetical protein